MLSPDVFAHLPRLVPQHQINSALVRPVVDQSRKGGAQPGEGQSSFGPPALGDPVLFISGQLILAGVLADRVAVDGDKEESTVGVAHVLELGAIRQVAAQRCDGGGHKRADAADAGLAAREDDHGTVQIGTIPRQARNVGRDEAAAKAQVSGSQEQGIIDHGGEGSANLLDAVGLVGLGAGGAELLIAGFDPIRPAMGERNQVFGLLAGAGPVKETIDVLNLTPLRGDGAMLQHLGIFGEMYLPDVAGEMMAADDIPESPQHVDIIIIGAAGPRAGLDATPHAGQEHLDQAFESDAAGGDGADATAADRIDAALEQSQCFIQRHRLADVFCFPIDRFVPAVALGTETGGGAEPFLFARQLWRPLRPQVTPNSVGSLCRMTRRQVAKLANPLENRNADGRWDRGFVNRRLRVRVAPSALVISLGETAKKSRIAAPSRRRTKPPYTHLIQNTLRPYLCRGLCRTESLLKGGLR